jgi:ubiquinone biosynthesis protein UbiJ
MTQSPFPLPGPDALKGLLESLPQPPDWLKSDIQNRVILLLNHVLMQEPQAMDRLRRQQGKVVALHWGPFVFPVQPTPAGLLGLAQASDAPDLRLTVPLTSPLTLLQTLAQGQKPPVDIQGDVQLAAEVAWLADNVRWDVEEDLSRIVGDAAAYQLVAALKTLRERLQTLVGRLVRREPQ